MGPVKRASKRGPAAAAAAPSQAQGTGTLGKKQRRKKEAKKFRKQRPLCGGTPPSSTLIA